LIRRLKHLQAVSRAQSCQLPNAHDYFGEKHVASSVKGGVKRRSPESWTQPSQRAIHLGGDDAGHRESVDGPVDHGVPPPSFPANTGVARTGTEPLSLGVSRSGTFRVRETASGGAGLRRPACTIRPGLPKTANRAANPT